MSSCVATAESSVLSAMTAPPREGRLAAIWLVLPVLPLLNKDGTLPPLP